MRRLLDRIDGTLGRLLSRALGSLCLVAAAGGLWMAVSGFREQGFAWVLLMPLATGLGFLWLGVWLWRVKRRLSDFDLSGI